MTTEGEYNEPRVLGRTYSRWRRDVGWGVVGGCLMALYYTTIAILIYLIRGPAAFGTYGITFGQTVLAYWAGGVAGGLVLGVLLPVARNRLGKGVLGILVALPVFVAIALIMGDLHWGAVLVCATFFGIVGAMAVDQIGGPTWDEISHLEETVVLPDTHRKEIDARREGESGPRHNA
jgi:hypothetical protein